MLTVILSVNTCQWDIKVFIIISAKYLLLTFTFIWAASRENGPSDNYKQCSYIPAYAHARIMTRSYTVRTVVYKRLISARIPDITLFQADLELQCSHICSCRRTRHVVFYEKGVCVECSSRSSCIDSCTVWSDLSQRVALPRPVWLHMRLSFVTFRC